MVKPEIIDIPLHQDDRGYVYCALDCLINREIQRTYVVENFSRGMIRAWHGHQKADTYMHVINGASKIATMCMDNLDDINMFTVSSRKPQIVCVPAGYYNGTMSLEDGTKILVYSTLTFDEVKEDDCRMSCRVKSDIWEVKFR